MMEKTLKLPRLGETMEEGPVLAWSKISGEEYDRGDILLELETDKMVVEVPALEDGKILEILAEEGAVVAIGEPIARVEVESSEAVIEADSVPETTLQSVPPPQEQPSTTTPSPSQEVDEEEDLEVEIKEEEEVKEEVDKATDEEFEVQLYSRSHYPGWRNNVQNATIEIEFEPDMYKMIEHPLGTAH